MPETQNPYRVLVRDLVHRPGEMRERTLDFPAPERLGTDIIAVPAGEEVEIDLRLESLHDGILASAEVATTAEGECARCLTEVRLPVEVEFQELFAYSVDEAFDYSVVDDHLDLEPVVRDAVVLALPFQPVCQEDCPGLCAVCGARLLDDPGHEHEAPTDPRWAALAGLGGLTGAPTEDVDGAASGTTEEKR